MYICLCRALTEKQLEKTRQENPTLDTKRLIQKLKVGLDCGSCHKAAVACLEAAGRENIDGSGPLGS